MKLSVNRIIYTIIALLSLLFLIFIISTNIVPLKYLLLLFAIFILYDVGLFFLLFKKHKIKNIIGYVLSGILVIIMGVLFYYLNVTMGFFKGFGSNKYKEENYLVLVLNDSGFESLNDLSNIEADWLSNVFKGNPKYDKQWGEGTKVFIRGLFNSHSKNNKEGKIIIISSLAGIFPIQFLGSYCATKASIIMLAKVLQKELKIVNPNIKIKIIEPGIYKTGFNEIMIDNKNIDNSKYFKSKKNDIEIKDYIMFDFLAHKKLNSISKQIIKAIQEDNNKLIYKAPFFQSIFSKIYQIFKS